MSSPTFTAVTPANEIEALADDGPRDGPGNTPEHRR
jgi:hypothetical protein